MCNLIKNYFSGSENRVKLLRLVMSMLILISMGIGLASCSSDDKAKVDEPVIDNASGLYGIRVASWTTESINTTNWENTIIFNSKGEFLIEDIVSDVVLLRMCCGLSIFLVYSKEFETFCSL